MHKLSRQIRFSINPFLDETPRGANSYCSEPAGSGLALYLQLRVSLVGSIENDTGFFVNVHEVDQVLKKHAVPVFSEYISDAYRSRNHVTLSELKTLMIKTSRLLKDKIDNVTVSDITLELNPNRKLEMDCEDNSMVYLSEKYEFAAMHKLWNEKFSDEKNRQIFGKCAHPSGHGHNYIVEVTVKANENIDKINYGLLEQTVTDNLIDLLDHRNLNADIEYFKENNPTIENLAVFAWNQLADKFQDIKLHAVTVWETDKTFCTYYG